YISSAAEALQRLMSAARQKIKKDGRKTISIQFEETEDIIAAVGASNPSGRIVVGFAAESESLLENAEKKLREKGLDMIVANDILRKDAGFDVETNAATILRRDGSRRQLSLQSKRDMADLILDEILKLRTED